MPWLCPGAEPQFQEGVKILSNGQAINVPVGHLVPCVADWNKDGKMDLLVGNFYSAKRPIGGNLWLFVGK